MIRILKYLFMFLLFLSLRSLFSQNRETELKWIAKSIEIPSKYFWYNPNLPTLQLKTNRDDIYALTGRDIIEIDNRFNGIQKKFLQLVHNGIEQPIFFTSDTPNLSEKDTIFFIGSRPKGDTTWFDCFSSYESFYLVYDESTVGSRFTKNSLINPVEPLQDFANYFEHFEEHHKYSIGMPEFSSETVQGEGWVWELLQPNPSPITSKSIKINFDFTPAFVDDSIYFKFFAFSARFEQNKTIHKLLVKINGDTAYLNTFPPGPDIHFSFSFPTSKILFGKNEIEIISLGLSLPDSLQPEDIIGLQYIEVGYRRYLLPENNLLKFSIKQTDAKTFEIFGFQSSELIAIDTVNNQIFFGNAEPASYFITNVRPDSPAVKILINDSLLESTQNGLHICTFEPDKNTITYTFFNDNSTQILPYLNSLSASTILFSVFNGTSLSNDAINYFEERGSQKVRLANEGYVWAFAQNPQNGEIFETTSSNYKLLNFKATFLTQSSNTYKLNIAFPPAQERFLFISPKNMIMKPVLNKVDSSNLFSTSNQADVIVIAPKEFTQTAMDYINFRKETHPSLHFFFASVENIYKEFNFGKKSPQAIKRFLVWAFNKWQKPRPKFLVIFGDANWDSRQILQNSTNKDFVPSYGWPATDFWYSLIDSVDFNADIAVGRIPIRSNEEGKHYIQKLIEYETAEESPWMKNFLFLSGGITEFERDYFYDLFKGYFVDYILANSPICANPITIRKSDPSTVGESDASSIRSAINNGVQLMYFAGHGSALVFDTDGWNVQTLNNKGKYGFFASFSCNTATFAEPNITSRNEEYVIWQNKGFIGTLGSGGVSFRVNSLSLGYNFLSVIANPKYKTSNFVELLNIAKRQQSVGEYFDVLTIYHYNFLGDPLLEFRIPRNPDLYFIKQTIKITNENNSSNFLQTDSFFVISGTIANLGFSQFGKSYKLRLLHSFNGIIDSVDEVVGEMCSKKIFSFKLPIKSQVGIHFFRLLINPEREIIEDNFSNNSFEAQVEVYSNPIFLVEPQPFWNVSAKVPLFRFIDPTFAPDSFEYHFAIYSRPDTSSPIIIEPKPNELYFSKTYIQWQPSIQLDTGTYWLYTQRVNKITKAQTSPLWVNFNTLYPKDSSNVLLQVTIDGNLNLFEMHNLYFNPVTQTIQLKPDTINYKILSASSRRGKEILINNRVHVTYSPETDLVGFYVVVLSHQNFKVSHNKYFDTWAPKDSLSQLLDSNSIKLYYFLKDSIPQDDYVFLIAYGSSFALPYYHSWLDPRSPGSMDSIRAILKEWGCQKCDSLGIDPQIWGSSYFLIARNSKTKKLISEGFNLNGDTISSEGFILQFPKSATISTDYFGPSINWKYLKFHLVSDSSIEANIKVIGKSKTPPFTDTIVFETTTHNVDLSEVDPNLFSFLRFQIEISNPNEVEYFEFRKLLLEYKPPTELAIETLQPVKNISLDRGEELHLTSKIYNLSSRSKADEIRIVLSGVSNRGVTILDTMKYQLIKPNSIFTFQTDLTTDNFDSPIKLELHTYSTTKEFFQFNNTDFWELNLFEDTIRPEIKLYADSYLLKDEDFVSRCPNLLIEIYDNTRMPYDFNSTHLLINAHWIDLLNKAQFTSFGRNYPLKCSYLLESDSLEFGTNYFTIYTTDPSGNRDTLDVKVILSKLAQIKNELVFPNPTHTSTTFRFTYQSPTKEATARIDIFDQIGNLIRSIYQEIKLNENDIFWDGYDNNGNSTPQGVYYYRISVLSEIYSEPKFGKILKVQ
ncbi:MAG: C25 family cysteine peptidase [Candidatus Kapaibacteriales bacterium]